MALQVTPGPLPNDGDRFNPTTALDAFINATVVVNFDRPNFVGGATAFVISQTDAPSTNTVNRGLSWFRRGEGVLYHAHFFTPTEGPLSGVTQWKWVAASGSRKEQIVEYRFPVRQPGGPLRQTGEPTTVYGVQQMANRLLMVRAMQTQFTSHTDMSLESDTTASWLGFWAEHSTDPIFVALDTTVTDVVAGRAVADPCGWSGHDYHVAVECGLCQIATDTMYTGAGTKLHLIEGLNTDRFVTATGATFKVTDVEIAVGLDSSYTGEGTGLGFLRPSLTHRNV